MFGYVCTMRASVIPCGQNFEHVHSWPTVHVNLFLFHLYITLCSFVCSLHDAYVSLKISET